VSSGLVPVKFGNRIFVFLAVVFCLLFSSRSFVGIEVQEQFEVGRFEFCVKWLESFSFYCCCLQ
jgi:hypothetical protein